MVGLTGQDHRFDATNAAYRAFLGRDDLIGRSSRELFPELLGQQLFQVFDRIYVTGEPETLREWRFQVDLGQTGELQEIFLDICLAPRLAPDGSVVGITEYVVDVTEQVRQRQAAQRQAVDAERRFEAARDVVVEVQQALLETSLPVLPGAAVAARYLVAAHDQAAGGDWFDIVPLVDGTVAAIVGDIVGHGVAASAAMGQLRSVINAVLTQTGSLEQAVAWADELAARSPTMRAATMCIAVLDTAGGALRYATCGHLPPLVVTPEGASRYLALTGGGPLGTGSAPIVAEEKLQAGEVLLLYTDGLVERPGRPLDTGLDTLARVAGDAVANRVMPVGAAASAATRVCAEGVELLTRTGYGDDVTALAVQRRPEPIRPLHCDVPAEPAAIATVRTAVEGWLRPLEPTPSDAQAVDIAITELMANVIEHAYRLDPPGVSRSLQVDLELSAEGQLRLQVSDDGCWREPAGLRDESGRGLWLVGALLDALTVDHDPGPRTGAAHASGAQVRSAAHDGPDARDSENAGAELPATGRMTPPGLGTTVSVRHLLRRPAVLASEERPTPPRGPVAPYRTELDDGPPRTLRVSGPLDLTTTERFSDRVDTASRGGTQPLVLDLSGVDLLSSAAVRVLYRHRDQHLVHGHTLTIRTIAGSTADQVLNLVGLDHDDDGEPGAPIRSATPGGRSPVTPAES